MTRLLTLVLILVACVSCAKGTPSNPILPPGLSPTPLPQPAYVGIGRYQKLDEISTASWTGGVPFVSFLEVRQPSRATILHNDVPGYVYAAKAAHVLSRDDGERVTTINEGDGNWVDAGTRHENPSGTDAVWYFVALRSVGLRGAPVPFPSAKVLYATPDLPTPPSGKALVHQLGLITMAPGGRTSAHSHGGSESFFVINGAVELALNDGTRTEIRAGQGGSIKPGLVMQLHVIGDAPVTILTYFVTPESEPWQTNLQTLP